jgi:hypothetical protein
LHRTPNRSTRAGRFPKADIMSATHSCADPLAAHIGVFGCVLPFWAVGSARKSPNHSPAWQVPGLVNPRLGKSPAWSIR